MQALVQDASVAIRDPSKAVMREVVLLRVTRALHVEETALLDYSQCVIAWGPITLVVPRGLVQTSSEYAKFFTDMNRVGGDRQGHTRQR